MKLLSSRHTSLPPVEPTVHKCGIIIFTPYLYVKCFSTLLAALMESAERPSQSVNNLAPTMFTKDESSSHFTLSRECELGILMNQ